MKHLVEWYKECLKNSMNFVASKEKEVSRTQAEILKHKIANIRLQNQIDRAEREGKLEFDADRYDPYPKNK